MHQNKHLSTNPQSTRKSGKNTSAFPGIWREMKICHLFTGYDILLERDLLLTHIQPLTVQQSASSSITAPQKAYPVVICATFDSNAFSALLEKRPGHLTRLSDILKERVYGRDILFP